MQLGQNSQKKKIILTASLNNFGEESIRTNHIIDVYETK